MKKIAIIGMGTMGSAIGNVLKEDYEITGIGKEDSLRQAEDADAVILAMKPQVFGDVADELELHIRDNQVILSIMAGIATRRICRRLHTQHVVRTMPNLALATGNSLTAWYTEDKNLDTVAVQALLGKWGASMQLSDERQFDAFTALAGSGPAYLFELARILEQQASSRGFTVEQARQIATHTFLGAASLVTPGTDFGAQVANVASKGGTTQAALEVFAQNDLEGIVSQTIDAACQRSQQLGDHF